MFYCMNRRKNAFKKILSAKLNNNAELEKRFWKINAVHPINKDI